MPHDPCAVEVRIRAALTMRQRRDKRRDWREERGDHALGGVDHAAYGVVDVRVTRAPCGLAKVPAMRGREFGEFRADANTTPPPDAGSRASDPHLEFAVLHLALGGDSGGRHHIEPGVHLAVEYAE